MGYKEIQGDEGVILVRAAAALTGDDAELFLHQKGPMEILLPLMTWGVTGAFNEFWARLPFLWAGLLGVAALTLLARRWFNGRVAFIAGLLFAIMGFGIAFSRIIQYQTLVMLWGLLALLTATRYREEGRPLDLYVTAVFLAGGLLAHYDAVLVVPAVGWVLGSGERGVARGEWHVREWVIAGLLGAGVLGLFYAPFALNPNFGRTVRYLLNDRVGTEAGLTDWSGTAVWQMMTFYNSTYFIVGLMGLLLVGLWRLWRHREGGSAVLTFLVPALFYVFVVSDPRTHVYTIFPGAIILAAVGRQLWMSGCKSIGGCIGLVWSQG
jgi:4-amino-4-deoxy-L-arabinose transferase-like glycosyltransferase